jgi:UDP-glucose 4-epimerase
MVSVSGESMKVLVTGSRGFVGQHVLKGLAERGFDAVGTDRLTGEGTATANINQFDEIDEVFGQAKPDAVVHLAAICGTSGTNEVEQSMRQPLLNFKTNIFGTANVCEACRRHGVKKLIYMSSFAVYGKTGKDRLPITEQTSTSANHAYAVSKLAGEEVVKTYSKDFGIKSVILRTPNIAGEFQKERNVLREFIECAQHGKPMVIYGDGNHIREFIHPTDLTDAFANMLSFLEGDVVTDLFVIGNKGIQARVLADTIAARVGKGEIEYRPNPLGVTFDQYSDFSKATRILSYQPKVSVGDIIDRIITLEAA